MEPASDLQSEVHGLLDEANVLSLLPISYPARAVDLIGRLRHCADQAGLAGTAYEVSQRRLRAAADALEAKLAATGQAQ